MRSKRYLTTVLFALTICSSGLLINCASYSSFQTARTLPQGKVSGTAGLGYNYLGEESFVDLALRVGLEDSLTIARGTLARSNAEQVEKVRGIVEALGRVVMSADEARALLDLKGADRVAI